MQRIRNATLVLIALASCNLVAADWPDFPFIFVVGDASQDVKPDLFRLSFTVKTFNKESEASLKAFEAASAAALNVLREAGVKADQIEAFQVDKSAVRTSQEYRSTEILGYECSRNITATISEIDSFSSIVGKLLALDNVIDLSPSFDVSNRTEIENSLISDAVKHGIERAGQLAKSAGAAPGEIFSMSEEPYTTIPGKFALSTNLDGLFERSYKKDSEAGYFVPSKITLEKKVNLIIKTSPGRAGR